MFKLPIICSCLRLALVQNGLQDMGARQYIAQGGGLLPIICSCPRLALAQNGHQDRGARQYLFLDQDLMEEYGENDEYVAVCVQTANDLTETPTTEAEPSG